MRDQHHGPRGGSGWQRIGQVEGPGWQPRGGKAHRLLAALDRMMANHEALSMAMGPRGETRVVGGFTGDPRRGVWIESGRDVLFLDDRDIDWVEESEGLVVATGRFEGGTIAWRAYEKRPNRGQDAAKRCGGEAGRICREIERMMADSIEGECIGVELSFPNEGPHKLQWHEFDESNGEIVLMVGRLDRMRQVRLRSDRLGMAEFMEDELRAESFRGRVVTLAIMDVSYLVNDLG